MDRTSLNITEICQKNFTDLNLYEFQVLLDGYCDSNPTEIFTESTEFSSPSPTGYVVYHSILVCGGIILNLLVMLTIFSRARLRTVPNAFMVSLSIADFLMATVAIPLRIAERLEENNYILTSMIYPLIGVASIFSLCCVTIDRYIHIKNPLNYDKYMNKSRAIGIVAGLWILSTFQSLAFFLVHDSRFKEAIYNDIRLAYGFIVPAILISLSYMKLFLVAKSHVRVIATTTVTIPHADRPWSQKKDFKILKVIALIVGTFVVCWFPFLFSVSYELHAKSLPSKEFYLLMGISECLACSTCVLNPLIYGFLRRDLRISMRYVAKCKRDSIEESESL